MLSYIYLTSGIAKVFSWQGNVQFMQRHNLHFIPSLLAMALIIELVGSLSLITGWKASWAAFVMFAYTAIMTMLLHNYWSYTGEAAGMQETHFRKNLAIMGGLLMLSYCGPGKWQISELWLGWKQAPRY